jgi:predicted transcriptional regulator
MLDGMKSVAYRTTFSLDEATERRLTRLASAWNVSRAEVVRRAVAKADAADDRGVDAGAVLDKLQASGGGLVREQAEAYLADVRAARADWRSGS